MKKTLLTLSLILSISLVFGQSKEIKIKFIGNCGMHLTDGSSNIYIDFPYKSGAHNYMEYDKSELDKVIPNSTFIFTHKHSDHFSRRLLSKMKGKKYGTWNVNKIGEISKSIPEFELTSYRTQHKVFGISFEHYSYLMVWHNKRIFFSGDAEKCDTLVTMKDIDYMFLPAWSLSDAFERNFKIDAKFINVYHIGPKDNISSSSPKIRLLKTSGEYINIPLNE